MIRVLRLLEYEYSTAERASSDMERWSVPANGTHGYTGSTIRSAIIFDLDSETHSVQEVLIKVNATSPNIVVNDRGNMVGCVTHWNPSGIGEAVVQYFDGSADSATFKELKFLHGEEAARKYLDDKKV